MEKKVMGEPLVCVVYPLKQEFFIKFIENCDPIEIDETARAVFDYLKKRRVKPRKYKGFIYFLWKDVAQAMGK
jgi:hypothetical protein